MVGYKLVFELYYIQKLIFAPSGNRTLVTRMETLYDTTTPKALFRRPGIEPGTNRYQQCFKMFLTTTVDRSTN